MTQRLKRNIQTKMRMARLPYQKTLAEFDFAFQPSVDKKLIDELATIISSVRRPMSSSSARPA
jgi:DNA replication protein DnaC